MAQSKITLIGLENYLNPEHSVFEKMVLPDGIDKDTLIGSIILRCQEFELLYSDPDFMTAAVNVWSRKNYWTFDKWAKLLEKSYDPLFNKDYFEEWTDTHEGDYSKSGTGSSEGSTSESSDFTRTDNLSQASDTTRTDNLSQASDTTRTDNLSKSSDYTRTDNLSTTNDVTVTHSEKAFNSGSTWQDTTKDVTDQDGSQTGTQRNAGTESQTGTVRDAGTVTNTGTQREAGTVSNTGTVRDAGSASGSYGNMNSSSESGDDNYENKHTYHGWGNIGITSAQELFLKETDVARWNMYEHIADLFASEFCIMVY